MFYVAHETLENGYVVATSWARVAVIFDDGLVSSVISNRLTLHTIHPTPSILGVETKGGVVNPSSWLIGHTHDVLAVDYWPPNTLATGCYDGVVHLWNLVSGHNFMRLVPPEFDLSSRASNHDRDAHRKGGTVHEGDRKVD